MTAWRFAFPGLDAPAHAGGPQTGALGTVSLIDGDAEIRQALLMLLSTTPGERVMRPDYGCDLRRLAFMPNDDTTAGLAMHFIRQAVERWEPRIDVVALDAGADPQRAEALAIQLDYRVRASDARGTLRFAVDLGGDLPDASR